MITFLHSGDIGDLIYSLPTIKALLKRKNLKTGVLYLFTNNHETKMRTEMAEFIKPLLDVQSYLREVIITNTRVNVDYDLDVWRRGNIYERHIALLHADFQGVEVNLKEPWLELPKKAKYTDVIVLARSSRNQNREFKWDNLLTGLTGRFVFVGTEVEYNAMNFDRNCVKHVKVMNALDLAYLISSCSLFIGNQSFPYAIAEALKVPRIQETSSFAPNCLPTGKYGVSSIGLSMDKLKEAIVLFTNLKKVVKSQ